MKEEFPQPTPTQEELNRIKSGEAFVTDSVEAEEGADGKSDKAVSADKPAAYKTRQAKAE